MGFNCWLVTVVWLVENRFSQIRSEFRTSNCQFSKTNVTMWNHIQLCWAINYINKIETHFWDQVPNVQFFYGFLLKMIMAGIWWEKTCFLTMFAWHYCKLFKVVEEIWKYDVYGWICRGIRSCKFQSWKKVVTSINPENLCTGWTVKIFPLKWITHYPSKHRMPWSIDHLL